MYTKDDLSVLGASYEAALLNDILPFWTQHAVDTSHGGFITALDRDGTVIDTDKGLWQQGRFTWLLATLHSTIEPRSDWLNLARHGLDFIETHGYAPSGHMYFQVDRAGRPLRERRYAFSESFAAIALAAFSRASGDSSAAGRAREAFDAFRRFTGPDSPFESKVNVSTRPSLGLGPLMIQINTAQVLRSTLGDAALSTFIDHAIDQIEALFLNQEYQVLLETVGPRGEVIDHFDGRLLNPGHSLEAAWFILHEAAVRGGDARLMKLGCTILDWMWARGWDEEYGGIRYFCDLKCLPVQEYWHDMKFWWPQNEAIIATLLAGVLTGESRYFAWHRQAHEWAHRHFTDPDHGEWFGYLHRDGRRSVLLKGNLWKGPFHIPRMYWYCARICQWAQDKDRAPFPDF